MIDTFFKAIYHTYSFDNKMIIKMNDTMIDVFYTMYSNLYHFTHFRMVLKLIFDMLAGRLELFPMLLIFVPDTWRKY